MPTFMPTWKTKQRQTKQLQEWEKYLEGNTELQTKPAFSCYLGE